MTVNASRPAAPAPVTAPPPAPTPADREPGSPPAGNRFAELLRQNRVAERAPAETPRPVADRGATPEPAAQDADGGDAAPPLNDSSPKSDAGRARARSGTGSRPPARPTIAAERPERAGDEVAQRSSPEDDRTPDAATTAPHPAAAPRPETSRAEAGLRFGAAAQAKQGAAPGSGDPDSLEALDPAGASDAGADAARGRPRRTGSDALGAAPAGRATGRARDADPPPAAASFTQVLADAKAQDRPGAAGPAGDRLLPAPPLAVALQEPLHAAAPAGELASASASLPVPLESPEFAAAFGVQVSVFVREGVQRAELHLNPVETGPVSIEITLDGTQAHVAFGADLAATRQAIENGLPALASALRDAGFTLAGGGVAQHSRQGGGRDGDDPAARSRGDGDGPRGREAVAPAGPHAIRRVAAGGIDLYA